MYSGDITGDPARKISSFEKRMWKKKPHISQNLKNFSSSPKPQISAHALLIHYAVSYTIYIYVYWHKSWVERIRNDFYKVTLTLNSQIMDLNTILSISQSFSSVTKGSFFWYFAFEIHISQKFYALKKRKKNHYILVERCVNSIKVFFLYKPYLQCFKICIINGILYIYIYINCLNRWQRRVLWYLGQTIRVSTKK